VIKSDMLNTALQLETLNPEVRNYIKRIKTDNFRLKNKVHFFPVAINKKIPYYYTRRLSNEPTYG
jgi:hypothetical protein